MYENELKKFLIVGNDDIVNGMREYIKDYTDISLEDLIKEFCKLDLVNDEFIKPIIEVNNSKDHCISELNDMYELIEFMIQSC